MSAFARDGHCVARHRIDDDLLGKLDATFRETSAAVTRGGERNVLERDVVKAVVASPAVRAALTDVGMSSAFATRALLFDKTPSANWKVIWHQDLTVAVEARVEVSGFGPWSVKAGVAHSHAPAELLSRMVNVRVHLDDVDENNGPLRVLSGSHARGKLADRDVLATDKSCAVVCLARRGEMFMFRPLLLHASSEAAVPRNRRVLQLEFAAEDLAAPLRWRWRVHVGQ